MRRDEASRERLAALLEGRLLGTIGHWEVESNDPRPEVERSEEAEQPANSDLSEWARPGSNGGPSACKAHRSGDLPSSCVRSPENQGFFGVRSVARSENTVENRTAGEHGREQCPRRAWRYPDSNRGTPRFSALRRKPSNWPKRPACNLVFGGDLWRRRLSRFANVSAVIGTRNGSGTQWAHAWHWALSGTSAARQEATTGVEQRHPYGTVDLILVVTRRRCFGGVGDVWPRGEAPDRR
jgi:hypothetical protein